MAMADFTMTLSDDNYTYTSGLTNDSGIKNVMCSCYPPEIIEAVWTMQRTQLLEIAPIITTTLFLIFMLLGLFGNALVIYVFATKITNQTSCRCFIIALAIMDFLVCLLVIPGEIFRLWLFPFKADFVCKLWELSRESIIPITALVLVAIAFDRYFLICKAPATIITPRSAKLIIVILVIIGTIMGIIPMLSMGVHDSCNCYIGLCQSTDLLIESSRLLQYFYVMVSMYGMVIVTISILYIFVFLAVRQRSKRWGHRRAIPKSGPSVPVSKSENSTGIIITGLRVLKRGPKQHNIKRENATNGTTIKLLNENVSDIMIEANGKEDGTDMVETNGNVKLQTAAAVDATTTLLTTPIVTIELVQTEDGDNDSIATKHSLANSCDVYLNPQSAGNRSSQSDSDMTRGSTNSLPARQTSPEVKTAQILCLVTFCFIIAYLPFFVVYFFPNKDNYSNHGDVGKAILSILHYTNHFVNPFIYGFMNRNFKSEVAKMIESWRKGSACLKCCKKH